MRRTKNYQKKMNRLLYMLGCSAVIMLLVTGCLPQGEEVPNDNVEISTVGDKDTVATTPQQVQLSDKHEADQKDAQTNTQKDTQADQSDNKQPQDKNPYGIDPSKPMIALTFDDGPSQYTWDIVNTLKAHNARATFFLLGSSVATHEAAIDYTLANHNEIASHSFSHKNMTKISDTELINQIRTVDAVLLEQHAYTPALFRVPYGSRDERVLAALKAEGKPAIGWNVDPHDWEVRDKDYVKKVVLDNVKDGDIILMHDIYESTAQAVAELVPILQERGYQIVTVSELFQHRGMTPQPGEYYRELPPISRAE